MRVVESVIERKAALYSHRPPEDRRFEQFLFAFKDRTAGSVLFLADLLTQCGGLKDLKYPLYVGVLQILPWVKISRRKAQNIR